MLIAIGLALIGLLLVYFEFFVPGAVLGILGGIFMIAGLILFIWEQNALYLILVYVIGLILLLVMTIRLAIWKVKKTGDRGTLYLGKDQEGYVSPTISKELVGKTGTTKTNLKPSGHIIIDGKPYQAVSENGYIKKNEEVKIIGCERSHFIVRKD